MDKSITEGGSGVYGCSNTTGPGRESCYNDATLCEVSGWGCNGEGSCTYPQYEGEYCDETDQQGSLYPLRGDYLLASYRAFSDATIENNCDAIVVARLRKVDG